YEYGKAEVLHANHPFCKFRLPFRPRHDSIICQPTSLPTRTRIPLGTPSLSLPRPPAHPNPPATPFEVSHGTPQIPLAQFARLLGSPRWKVSNETSWLAHPYPTPNQRSPGTIPRVGPDHRLVIGMEFGATYLD